MRRNLIHFALMAGVLAVTGTAAFAQNLQANIPFDFQVSGKTLPAGQYSLNRLTMYTGAGWTLRHFGGREAAMAISTSGGVPRPGTHNKPGALTFKCVGAACALQSLYAPGAVSGYAFRAEPRNVDPKVQVATIRVVRAD